jgi:hypothetical protein
MYLDRVFVRVNGEQLRAVLAAIASKLEGFSADDVDQLCADVAVLEPDDDALIEPLISFQGDVVPFVVDVFKDAQGSLEAVFLVPRTLTSLVQDVAGSVVGTSAVRSIAADQEAGSE